MTMVWKKLVRILRRRSVLGLIFTCSLMYCVVSLWLEYRNSQAVSDNSVIADMPAAGRRSRQFQWHSLLDEHNQTLGKLSTCRNSVQGKQLITDDRGYVCSRTDILPSGCCDTDAPNTKHYSCETCQSNGCCQVYEHCLSCCLHPGKKPLLQVILGKASETFNILYASVTDHFELCLAKCRTSSQSVMHENTYRDSRAKYCYGEAPPSVHLPASP